ncbi:MAG: conjugal transfer protein TraR [Ignavibacteriae bacterium]|nr:conjugal transfer protein TraR [Ignavibacteriota bacterium]
MKKTVSTKKSPAAKTTKKTSAKAAKQKEVEVISPSKKVKKIKGYNKADLEKFKQVILDKREEIIEQLQNLKDQMMDPTTGQYVNESSPYSLHMAEQGTDAQEREKLYLWAQRANKFLGYLEDALQRIESGTYGICIDCIDEPKNLCPTCPLVPKDRLMAVPHTQHCLQVKQTMRKS